MRIRYKFFLVVLPLVILPVLIAGLTSALAARNEITRIAQSSLEFKAEQLRGYAESQWRLLVANDLTDEPRYIAAAQHAVETFAVGLIRSPSELILAVEPGGSVAFSTEELEPGPDDVEALGRWYDRESEEWGELVLDGTSRVAQSAHFAPFDWMLLVTEREDSFFAVIRQIYGQSSTIAGISLAASLLLLFVFARHLLHPLDRMAGSMRHIMASGDLSHRVALFYHDEFGDLGHTFNLMTDELEKAYDEIKRFAYQAAIARRQEQKVRTVFQRYVPIDVLDQLFANPESMLVGANRELAVLFSDIRGFTSISENLPPDRLIESLNDYFSRMVDLIYTRDGIVDKYIGDAIMAFFGAPVRHDNDALLAVEAGLDMLDAIGSFNESQRARNLPEFRTGIGVNFGQVTIGNVGSERKMDYTVMGDMVNLASRLEGLTKIYRVPMIISESVAEKVRDTVSCQFVDTVTVKGKQYRTKIYAPRRRLSANTEKGWKLYHAGVKRYYAREFAEARRYLIAARKLLPNDPLVARFLSRSEELIEHPPPERWTGVVELSEK